MKGAGKSDRLTPAALGYKWPTGGKIRMNSHTQKLYELEERASAAFKAAGVELGRVLEHAGGDFYTKTLPEALLTVLMQWDNHASYYAARAYVEWYEKEEAEETRGSGKVR